MIFTETSLPAVEMTTAEFLALPRRDSLSTGWNPENLYRMYDDLLDEWVMVGDPDFPACIITLSDDLP